MEDLVLYSVEDRIATITINRPEKKNAFSPELVQRLTESFVSAGKDDAVKIIILKSSGNIFSAGADLAYLKKLQNNTRSENVADSENLRLLYMTIYTLPKLVVAQVEGHAIAGGCGLATVCDFIFATPESKFGYTEVKLGFVPAIVSCFIIRKTGEAVAKELLYTGKLIDAETAKKVGLINFVTNKEDISLKVNEFVSDLCTEASGNSLMVTKQLLNQVNNPFLVDALDSAVQINAAVRETPDFHKGISNFLEKKTFKW